MFRISYTFGGAALAAKKKKKLLSVVFLNVSLFVSVNVLRLQFPFYLFAELTSLIVKMKERTEGKKTLDFAYCAFFSDLFKR